MIRIDWVSIFYLCLVKVMFLPFTKLMFLFLIWYLYFLVLVEFLENWKRVKNLSYWVNIEHRVLSIFVSWCQLLLIIQGRMITMGRWCNLDKIIKITLEEICAHNVSSYGLMTNMRLDVRSAWKIERENNLSWCLYHPNQKIIFLC